MPHAIQHVYTPGDYHPSRVVPEIKVVPVKAVGIKTAFRCRTEPEVVIYAWRRVSVWRASKTMRARMGWPENRVIQVSGVALIPDVEAMNQADLAERPVLNDTRGVGKQGPAALLQAHFQKPAAA